MLLNLLPADQMNSYPEMPSSKYPLVGSQSEGGVVFDPKASRIGVAPTGPKREFFSCGIREPTPTSRGRGCPS